MTVVGSAIAAAGAAALGSATFAGVAQDSTGMPIAGAAVLLTPANSSGSDLAAATQTAADGSFSVSGLAPGTYTVRIQGQNYGGLTSTVTVTGGANPPQTFPLQRGVNITGQILDADGNPVDDAIVDFINPTTDQVMGETTTDASGDYDDTTVPPGIYDLVVSESSHETTEQVGVNVGSNPQTINAALADPSTSLNGTVVDANGDSIYGVSVIVKNSAGETVYDTTTDDDGFYQILTLPPGSYTVEFQEQGYTVSTNNVNLSNGQSATQNGTLTSDGTATDNPTQTTTGTTQTSTPPGGSVPMPVNPQPITPPDPPLKPFHFSNDPAIAPPDLSQTICADAATAKAVVLADIARVANAYSNWQDAYSA